MARLSGTGLAHLLDELIKRFIKKGDAVTSVNGVKPSPDGNVAIDVVPVAKNLVAADSQQSSGAFVCRTSGGVASIADGKAWLEDVQGNRVRAEYTPQELTMQVNMVPREDGEQMISAMLDEDAFVEYQTESIELVLEYTDNWSMNPSLYGIYVTGTPKSGDTITVHYVKEYQGLITATTPTALVSTGWNLYDHSKGYARVVLYSDDYGYRVDGTYTALSFSETLTGERTPITVVGGSFMIPSDGYVFVSGGVNADTAIYATWSDWTEGYDVDFQTYREYRVDLSNAMTHFPNGLMRVGLVHDEIDLSSQKAISRIQRLNNTPENLMYVQDMGVEYEVDENYIYAVRIEPESYTISIDGEYTVDDHGIEFFDGTDVATNAQMVYGSNLIDKLRTDVISISAMDITEAQKKEARKNLGTSAGGFTWGQLAGRS